MAYDESLADRVREVLARSQVMRFTGRPLEGMVSEISLP